MKWIIFKKYEMNVSYKYEMNNLSPVGRRPMFPPPKKGQFFVSKKKGQFPLLDAGVFC